MSLGSLQYCHSIQSPSILQSEESVITYLLCPPLHKTQVPFCLSVSSGRSYFEFRNSEFCRGHAVDPIEQVLRAACTTGTSELRISYCTPKSKIENTGQ